MVRISSVLKLAGIAKKAIANKVTENRDKRKSSQDGILVTEVPPQDVVNSPKFIFSKLIALPESELKIRYELQEFSVDDYHIIVFLRENKENTQIQELIFRFELGEFSLLDFYQKLNLL